MKAKTHFTIFLAAFLFIASVAMAKSPADAGINGIAFRISNAEQADSKLTISPDASNASGTLEMQVSNNSRIRISGIITNAIEYRPAADGEQNIRFKLKSGVKGTYYLTVASAKGSSLSTMTLQ